MSDTLDTLDTLDPPAEEATPAAPPAEFVPHWRLSSFVPLFHRGGKPWADVDLRLSTLDRGDDPGALIYFRFQNRARETWQSSAEAIALKAARQRERDNEAAIRELSGAIDLAGDALDAALREGHAIEQAEAQLAQLRRQLEVLEGRRAALQRMTEEALARARKSFRDVILAARAEGRAAAQREHEAAAAELAALAGPILARLLAARVGLSEAERDQLRGDPGREIQ